ncbi:hypothetical protein GA0004736_1684 [Curtobacterium sp. 9128]|nr:hypothetical protein GA0004736_1684 [Curtobacterium sp. 9128]
MARVVNLMAVDIEPEELVTTLAELRPRGAKSFRTFVTDLANFGGSVRLGVANAARSYNEVALSADQLQDLKGLLNVVVPDDVALLRGRMRLFRADVQRKQFGLRDLRSGQVFEGRVTDRALTQLDHATINQVYDVVLTELVSFSQAVGEKKPTYTLDQLTGSSTEVPIDIERTTSQDQPE